MIGFIGDQSCFPSDIAEMHSALGAEDLSVTTAAGTHFGGPIRKGQPKGRTIAANQIHDWMATRFPVTDG